MFYEKKLLLFNPYDGIPDVFKSRRIDTFEDRVVLYKLMKKVIYIATYKDLPSTEKKDIIDFLQTHPQYLLTTQNGRYYGWDSEKEIVIPILTMKMDAIDYETYVKKNGYISYYPDLKDKTYYMEEREIEADKL